ncbi:MAG: N-6 DNA methylase [Fibromonadaceae bacterium]|nr:N-6 DNA methylase [Fibromonadaceae bacterium]
MQKGKVEHDVELSNEQNRIQKFENLLRDFYSYDYPYIKTKKSLVSVLATQSFYYSVALREFMADKENAAANFYVKFNGLFGEYQKSISYHYELEDFCDIYSQSLVYGLMLSCIDTGKKLDEKELDYLRGIPSEYKLLHEFLQQAYENRDLPMPIKIALINIGKNINLISIEDIQKEFAKTNNGKQNIVVYLYEDFLQEYDNLRKTEKRKEGGVYYTPSEVANFIARSVNGIIKTKFSMHHGYLSRNVKILDFACGTGTFLHSIFEQIIGSDMDDVDKEIVRNKIANDIYGFELLFTPYIIAHTILTRFLKEKGIKIDERLGIYLTNTLDISQHSISSLLPSLKREYEKAMEIKDREQILAIVGNPPYFNGKSQAEKGKIDSELNEYKKDLDEKKINLDDLYIKFIRFAEWKIERYGEGVVGIITNNSYLDGVTHRKMREHLYNTFDEIYIVNLHGNARKGEIDKNIFDIMVGVSIVFFVKLKKPTKKCIRYFSTLDNDMISRQEKLSFLENANFEKIKWKKLNPIKPYYWFVDKDLSLQDEYSKFLKITDIFEHYSSGIETKNDKFILHYSKNDLKNVVKNLISLSNDEISKKYNVSDSRDWTIEKARDDVRENFNLQSVLYRPFDYRYTSLSKTSKNFIAYPRYETAKHFEKQNIGLCFTRQVLGDNWKNIFISENIIESCAVSLRSREKTYIAPLYLYEKRQGIEGLGGGERFPNFTDEFKKFLRTFDFKPSPEKILAYIYAVLHSPDYRKKYIEFLKTDFPAVPFTKDKETFEKLAKLGQKLIDLHLLKNLPSDKEIKAKNIPQTNFTIESIHHHNDELFLHTTQKQNISFSGVTSKIYDFEIGSYKPIEKWLKYRIKDEVSLCAEDLKHLKEMIVAIKGTLEVMGEIDFTFKRFDINH